MAKGKINEKKIIKQIADRGKKLRKDGLFKVYDDTSIISAVSNIKETSGAFIVEFKSDIHIEYLNKLGILVSGLDLARTVSGTGVQITTGTNTLYISSKVGDWSTGELQNSYVEESLNNQFNKYNNRFINNSDYIRYNLNVDELLSTGKFIKIIEPDDNLHSFIKISNKMMKNLSKETTEVYVEVTKDYIEETDDTNKYKIFRIVLKDPISTTYCYYAFLD